MKVNYKAINEEHFFKALKAESPKVVKVRTANLGFFNTIVFHFETKHGKLRYRTSCINCGNRIEKRIKSMGIEVIQVV
jgi:hypothetical protein